MSKYAVSANWENMLLESILSSCKYYRCGLCMRFGLYSFFFASNFTFKLCVRVCVNMAFWLMWDFIRLLPMGFTLWVHCHNVHATWYNTCILTLFIRASVGADVSIIHLYRSHAPFISRLNDDDTLSMWLLGYIAFRNFEENVPYLPPANEVAGR